MRSKLITGRKFKSSTDDEITKMVRLKKAHLDQLHKENAQIKSTMVVFKSKVNDIGPQMLRQLHDLYEQTKNLEVKADSQLHRNKVFKKLIEYLQQEQIRARKEQDIRYSTLKASEQKQLKKNEHDAEQILIRQNQEIARINILREHLEVSRSQRVVYSNLFKKLEKEIKVDEEEFKQLLLETILIEEKRNEQANINLGLETKRKNIDKSLSRNETQRQNREDRMQCQTESASKIKDRQIQKDKQKSKCQQSYKSKNSYSSKYSDKKQNQQKQKNIQQYEKLEVFLQTMIVESQCKDLNQLMNQFQNIQDNNSSLVKQIERINAEIIEYQDISKRRRISNKFKILQQDDLIETITLAKSTSSILYDKESQIKLLRRDLMRIADRLGIQYSNPIQVNKVFAMIEKSLQGFVSVQNLYVSQFGEDECSHSKKCTRRGEEQQNTVEALIDRAEKYNESEKIFGKDCFEDEYCKEIIRVRRITKSKK